MAGLQWLDFDWENHPIHIRRAWSRGKVGPPKTKQSEASVPLPKNPTIRFIATD
jgi:hypothetical protein